VKVNVQLIFYFIFFFSMGRSYVGGFHEGRIFYCGCLNAPNVRIF